MADRIVTTEKADRTPNWDTWLWKSLLELWQLVALSLNIDPDTVDPIDDNRTGTVIFNESPLFDLRLRAAREKLGRNGVLEHPRYCWMSLPNFAACARGWGWDMPPEMLAMADIPAWVHESGVLARADEHDPKKQKAPTAELLAMAGKTVAVKADRGRTNAATATRETRKADRLRDLRQFIDDVYKALENAGHEVGENGSRKPLPVSTGALHSLFLVRHPEHRVKPSTLADDLSEIGVKLKPGRKRDMADSLANR